MNLNDFNVSFDWLSMTFVLPEDRIEKQDLLEGLYSVLTFDFNSPNEIERYNKSFRGYMYYHLLGEHIEILYEGPETKAGQRTCMLNMSGQACREFEERDGSWFALLYTVMSINHNITRFDFFIDDFKGQYCDIKMLYDKVFQYEYVSPLYDWNYDIGGNKGSRTRNKHILRIGASDTIIRIYDKLLERRAHEVEMKEMISFWTRYEVQLRHDKAKNFITKVLEDYDNLNKIVAEVLYGYLDFKEITGRSRIRDETTCDWWINFLGGVKKTFLVNQGKLESSITKKRQWHQHSVTKPELQILLSDPDKFIKFLFEGFDKKIDDLKKKDFVAINRDYNKRGLKKELTPKEFKDLYEHYKSIFMKFQLEMELPF